MYQRSTLVATNTRRCKRGSETRRVRADPSKVPTKWDSQQQRRRARGFRFKRSRETKLATPDEPRGFRPENSPRGFNVSSMGDVSKAKGQTWRDFNRRWLCCDERKTMEKVLSVYLIDSTTKRIWFGTSAHRRRAQSLSTQRRGALRL